MLESEKMKVEAVLQVEVMEDCGASKQMHNKFLPECSWQTASTAIGHTHTVSHLLLCASSSYERYISDMITLQ